MKLEDIKVGDKFVTRDGGVVTCFEKEDDRFSVEGDVDGETELSYPFFKNNYNERKNEWVWDYKHNRNLVEKIFFSYIENERN